MLCYIYVLNLCKYSNYSMSKLYLKIVYVLILLIIIIIAGLFIRKIKKPIIIKNEFFSEIIGDEKSEEKLGAPEISGWIAWWIEDDGYTVMERHKKELTGVSPGWLNLDKNKQLVETGKIDKKNISKKIRDLTLKLYPMMTTDLKDQELADFIKDGKTLDEFSEKLIEKLKEYNADGLDLDFENIGASYSVEFSLLIKKLGTELKKNNLAFSVTVQAQTGQNDWDGLNGQDLKLIGQLADEVRLMIYDRHGQFSKPGPITPMDWYQQVLSYSLKIIPKEKLVVGLPTYGYIWEENNDFKSFQFKDFIAYAEDKNYEIKRDSESSELNFTNSKSTGWLSDSKAVTKKIEYARKIGLNRFVLWNLSGTDEELFGKDWLSP
jgi:spore germination protein